MVEKLLTFVSYRHNSFEHFYASNISQSQYDESVTTYPTAQDLQNPGRLLVVDVLQPPRPDVAEACQPSSEVLSCWWDEGGLQFRGLPPKRAGVRTVRSTPFSEP